VGHSYGGMIITGVADQVPERIRRLVYWNAFVPNNGESLNDLIPPHCVALFDQVAAERGDSSVVLPFPIWREAFINDADAATAKKAYDMLNPHPLNTFSDKISLKTNPAAMQLGKSYVNCTEDTSLPHSLPWHPRLSEKLGFERAYIGNRKQSATIILRGGPPCANHQTRVAAPAYAQSTT
jgi:hypothetical protein